MKKQSFILSTEIPLIPNTFKKIFQAVTVISILITYIPKLFGLDKFLGSERGDISFITKVLLPIALLLLMMTKDKIEDEMLLQIRFQSIIMALIVGVVLYIEMLFLDKLDHRVLLSDGFNTLTRVFAMYFLIFYMKKRAFNKEK